MDNTSLSSKLSQFYTWANGRSWRTTSLETLEVNTQYIASFIQNIFRISVNISTGKFILRVVARNRVGCSTSDTILVDLKGSPNYSILLQFILYLVWNIGTQVLSSTLEIVEDEEPPSYSTSWEEHLFIGEHKGVPKVAISHLPPVLILQTGSFSVCPILHPGSLM